jgi:hypothetical protein
LLLCSAREKGILERTQTEELKKRIEEMSFHRIRTGENVSLKAQTIDSDKPTNSTFDNTILINPCMGVTYIERGKVTKGNKFPDHLNKTFYRAHSTAQQKRTSASKEHSPKPYANSNAISLMEKGPDSRIVTSVVTNTPTREIVHRKSKTIYCNLVFHKKDHDVVSVNKDKNKSYESVNVIGDTIPAIPPHKTSKHDNTKNAKYKNTSYTKFMNMKNRNRRYPQEAVDF